MCNDANNKVVNCTFENCYVDSFDLIPMVCDFVYTFLNNKMIGNRVGIDTKADTVTGGLLISCTGSNNSTLRINNCQFVSNDCSVVAQSAARVVAAPIYGKSGVHRSVANSVFYGNTMTADVPEEGVTLVTARSGLFEIAANDIYNLMSYVNCTFGGEGEGADLVYFGANYTSPKAISFVGNCIFTGPAVGYRAIQSDKAGQAYVVNCVMQNANLEGNMANLTVGGNVFADNPMLAVDEETGIPVPTVNVEGLTPVGNAYFNAANGTVGVVGYPGYSTASKCYSLTDRSEKWIISDFGSNTKDLLGNDRTAGAFAAGAVQVEFPDDGSSVLAVQVSDMMGGSVSPASQSVAGGEDAKTLTAVAADGYKFAGWRDAIGTIISTDAEYDYGTVGRYTRLTAVFSVDRQTTLTFSLDGKGTFTSTGTDTCTLSCDPNTPFPEVPEYQISEGWYFVKFQPALPDVVPVSDATYTAHIIPNHAVVYFDSAAAGSGDGSDWANAATTLASAFDLANGKAAFVEILVKKGVHYHPDSTAIVPLDGVTVRGGYTGNGLERVDDPAATVYSGDIGKNDVWQKADGTATETPVLDAQGVVSDPGTDSVYASSATMSDNATRLFDGSADDVGGTRGFVLEGLTFTGFGKNDNPQNGTLSAFARFGDAIEVTVTNCVFAGNRGGSGEWAGAGGVMRFATAATVADCTFIGNFGPAVQTYQIRSTKWEGKGLTIANDVFRNGYAYNRNGRGAGVVLEYGTGSTVSGCDFKYNCGVTLRDGFALCAYSKSAGMLASLTGCRFVENASLRCGTGYIVNTYGTTSDVLFEDNQVDGERSWGQYGVTDAGTSVARLLGDVIRCSFVGNEAFGTTEIGVLKFNGRTILNSTFAGNSATATNETGAVGSTLVFAGQQGAVIGSTFFGNAYTSAEVNFMVWNHDVGFQNDILWGAADDYVSFRAVQPVRNSVFYACTIKDFERADFIMPKKHVRANLTQDPQLGGAVQFDEAHLHAFVEMQNRNPSLRTGEDVYVDAAGKPWAYYNDDRTKWTDLSVPLYPGTTSKTVDDYTLVDTDICGVRRTQGKFNRGSTESYRKMGLLLLLK